jgi:hypothetical protein
MANQAKIMGSVTTTVRFITDMLKNQIVEKSRSELDLNENQLNGIIRIVETSIQDSYNRAMDQIMSSIEE